MSEVPACSSTGFLSVLPLHTGAHQRLAACGHVAISW